MKNRRGRARWNGEGRDIQQNRARRRWQLQTQAKNRLGILRWHISRRQHFEWGGERSFEIFWNCSRVCCTLLCFSETLSFLLFFSFSLIWLWKMYSLERDFRDFRADGKAIFDNENQKFFHFPPSSTYRLFSRLRGPRLSSSWLERAEFDRRINADFVRQREKRQNLFIVYMCINTSVYSFYPLVFDICRPCVWTVLFYSYDVSGSGGEARKYRSEASSAVVWIKGV